MQTEINKYYHIYNRGCNKEKIFHTEEDYEKLMHYILSSDHKDYFSLYAFALMPNHFHFFMKQVSEKPIAKWFQFIFNRYVQYFNRKYNRTGTIFESRIKTKEIGNEDYYNLIAHYIHNNPNNKFQRKYCSISRLDENSLICPDFYIETFGSIENYLKTFEEFEIEKELEKIEEYIWGNG
ncbi:MAG: transposase [Fidelibacterota bacterium]